MYLDSTYFTGQLHIPNLRYGRGSNAVMQAVSEQSLDWYIEKYEREFLIELLGRPLLDKMTTGVERGESEWIALRDQIYRVGDFSFSPAANYVYFSAMREMQSQTSMMGEVRGKQTHASVVSVYDKMVRVWNDMVKMCREIERFIKENREVYGDINCYWTPINKFGI